MFMNIGISGISVKAKDVNHKQYGFILWVYIFRIVNIVYNFCPIRIHRVCKRFVISEIGKLY